MGCSIAAAFPGPEKRDPGPENRDPDRPRGGAACAEAARGASGGSAAKAPLRPGGGRGAAGRGEAVTPQGRRERARPGAAPGEAAGQAVTHGSPPRRGRGTGGSPGAAAGTHLPAASAAPLLPGPARPLRPPRSARARPGPAAPRARGGKGASGRRPQRPLPATGASAPPVAIATARGLNKPLVYISSAPDTVSTATFASRGLVQGCKAACKPASEHCQRSEFTQIRGGCQSRNLTKLNFTFCVNVEAVP